jgi:subtilisin family serine protease
MSLRKNISSSLKARPFVALMALALSSFSVAQAEPNFQLKEGAHMPTSKPAQLPQWKANTLLVMPSKGAEAEEVSDTIKNLHGKVVDQIGDGGLTVYVVQVEPAYFAEAEKKLSKDKHFSSVQRDYLVKADQTATAPVNDPYYSSEWHLRALNVVNGWKVSNGGSIVIGVLDSGVNGSIADLRGKTYSGYDAVNSREGQSDVMGHGTMVSTTAAALTNNGVNTAAPARLAYIYPVACGYSDGSISSSAILRGIKRCGDLNIKIINISANGQAPYTFANKSANSVFHQYAKWYHDTKGGLIFNSAGNDPIRDPNSLCPYLIVVSAINNSGSLANFSTYGSPIWFTGPGTGIYCSSRTGGVGSVSGTSFSSPLVASVAALVWGAKPSMRNIDVENVLKSTAYKASGGQVWTQSFGYGMPNAEAALKSALGR